MMKKTTKKETPKKGTKLQQNLGVTDEEIKRAVATTYTIDVNKRKVLNKVNNEEPKMVD